MPAAQERPAIPADEVERIIAARVDQELQRRGSDLEKQISSKIEEMLAAARAGNGSVSDASEPSWINSLAMAIAGLTDQGTGRQKRLAPEVLVARQEAQKRMLELLVEAKTTGQKPHYRLVHKVYLDDQLVDPKWVDERHREQDRIIGWDAIPNSAMRPVNPIAEAIFEQFQLWTGGAKMPELKSFANGKRSTTLGGLTIVQGSGVRGPWNDAVHALPEAEAPHVGGSGLQVLDRENPVNRGHLKTTQILGTIHPPATQLP